MSEDTPTNGNGRNWMRHVPLATALAGLVVASVAAGSLRAEVGGLRERMGALEAATKDSGLEARVRNNTEAIGRLTAEYAGHLDKSGLQWSMLQADIAAIKSAINDLRRNK